MKSGSSACDGEHSARDTDLTQEIFDLNEQIRAQSFALVEPVAFPPDLTMRQLQVLIAAQRAEGLTVHAAADELGVTMPTASGLVDRLVEKGMITKDGDEADRRVRHINLTESGEATLGQLDSAFDRVLREMLSLLDHDELVKLRDNSRFMLQMIGRLQERRPPQD